MNLRKSLLLCVTSALAVAVASASTPAHACSCRPMQPPAAAAEAAEIIFVATPQPGLPTSSPGTPLKVTRVYKGSVSADENLERTDCSSPVDVVSRDRPSPGEVLIYGYRMVHGPVAPAMCSRSKLLQDAGEDIAFLEKTFRASAPVPSPASAASPPTAPTTAAPSTPATSPDTDAAPSDPLAAEPPTVPPGPRSGCACTAAAGEETSPRLAAVTAVALSLLALRRRLRARDDRRKQPA